MPLTGTELPRLVGPVPGPRSRGLVDLLARHECPAITARRARRAAEIGASDTDPPVWEEAVGAVVLDADGNRLLDLTSGFGVALLGHRPPTVVAAAQAQLNRLIHAMGDAFPDRARIELLEALARRAPPGLEVTLLGTSGSDAVDAARKTALLVTGRATTVVFEGAYHGLALGVLGLQAYRPEFTAPFRDLVGGEVRVVPWDCPESELDGHFAGAGLVLVEPIQGRGGIRVPRPGWLAAVARAARRAGALLATDEIQCGLGRSGTWWAADAEAVVPDLLLVGKALGGGLPLSAAVGSREIMNAWGASRGEALHTQTFLGHPVACAAAVASLAALEAVQAPQACAERGRALTRALTDRGWSVRGRGLMLAVTVPGSALALSRRLLERHGVLVLPAGPDSLSLTPPLVLTLEQIAYFAEALHHALAEIS